MPSHWSGSKGGAELQARYISQFLMSKADIELHYICRNYEENISNEIVHVIPSNMFSKYTYAFDRKSILGYFNEIEPDYIYQRVLCAYTGIAAQYCHSSKAKMLFHIANSPDAEPYSVRWNKKLLFNILEAYYRKRGVMGADYIVGQAIYQDKLLQKNFSRHCDIIMPNISPDVSALADVDVPEKIIVLWVANIKPQKGPQHYIDLASKHQNNPLIEFHMVGKVASDYARDIQCQAGEINNMVFHGEIAVGQVNQLMAKASVFINTSDFEGFPNTFIQAWMNETPVLSLNVDPDDIIKTNGLGEHCRTLDTLWGAFDNWIHNKPKLMAKGKACRIFALNFFSVDNANMITDLIAKDIDQQVTTG